MRFILVSLLYSSYNYCIFYIHLVISKKLLTDRTFFFTISTLLCIKQFNFIEILLQYNFTSSDCHSPTKTGYQLGNPSATTYGGNVSVDICDTGYTGSPSVSQISCKADGNWSNVSGCSIVSKYFPWRLKNLRQ